MKKIISSIVILLVLVVLIILGIRTHIPESMQLASLNDQKSSIENLCFYDATLGQNGLYDEAWLRADASDGIVNGELRNLPAEKDSKRGLFTGSISAADANGIRTIDAIWDTFAEGMQTKEQLIVKVSTDKADVGFSEMVDRGDGVYVYKDPANISYWKSIPTVSCDALDDHLIVEQYIRDNISTLSPDKASLGGTWYIIRTHLDTATHTGTMTYEDGHNKGTAKFSYSRNGNDVSITDIK